MSTLSLSLGNIGSEFGRAMHWKKKQDPKLLHASLDRMLELLDTLVSETPGLTRRRELLRLREVLLDHLLETHQYQNSLSALHNYFIQFALAARKTANRD